MAKKLAKTIVGLGAVAVASKVAYDKYKKVKEDFTVEEQESVDAEIKKYNAIFEKKVVEIEDEDFSGCEVKAIGAKAVIDLGLATFSKDVYINFSSTASTVTIILPEGVNATCDIDKVCSGVRNLVDNVDEEGIHTVYVIGTAKASNVEIIPVNFYVDDDDDFEDMDTEFDPAGEELSGMDSAATDIEETEDEEDELAEKVAKVAIEDETEKTIAVPDEIKEEAEAEKKASKAESVAKAVKASSDDDDAESLELNEL